MIWIVNNPLPENVNYLNKHGNEVGRKQDGRGDMVTLRLPGNPNETRDFNVLELEEVKKSKSRRKAKP